MGGKIIIITGYNSKCSPSLQKPRLKIENKKERFKKER